MNRTGISYHPALYLTVRAMSSRRAEDEPGIDNGLVVNPVYVPDHAAIKLFDDEIHLNPPPISPLSPAYQ